MPLLAKAQSLLRNLFHSWTVEADLDEEIDSYVEMAADEKIRAGMRPEEARRAVRVELGGVEQVKERVREERLGAWVYSVQSDCRYAFRQFRKNPGFTAVAVLTLYNRDLQRRLWRFAPAVAVLRSQPHYVHP
jgi:hypothetical protein